MGIPKIEGLSEFDHELQEDGDLPSGRISGIRRYELDLAANDAATANKIKQQQGGSVTMVILAIGQVVFVINPFNRNSDTEHGQF